MDQRNLYNLTDAELHRKLNEFGLPNVPVTETTRGILLKKLEYMLNGKVYYLKRNNTTQEEFSNFNKGTFISNNVVNIPQIIYDSVKDINNTNASFPIIAMPNKNSNSNMNIYAPQPIFESNSMSKITYVADCKDKHLKVNAPSVPYNASVVNRLLRLRDNNRDRHNMINCEESPIKTKQKIQTDNITDLDIALWSKICRKMHLPQICLKQTLVPLILLGSFILFFTILATAYLVKIPQISPIHESSCNLDVCTESESMLDANSMKRNCINTNSIRNAIIIVQKINDLLDEKSREHHCIDSNTSDELSYMELYASLNNMENKVLDLSNDILAAEYLIKKNPKWKILISKRQHVTIYENERKQNEEVTYSLLSPNLPWKCSLKKKLHRYFFFVGILVLFILLGFLVLGLIRVILNYKHQRELEINNLTKEIIKSLVLRASNSSKESEVVINHLRDEILPVKNRDKFLCKWNEAVRLLEETDSRIIFGVLVQNGEQYRTMKWNTRDKEIETPFLKKWQSPAFSTVNNVINPPTPCLKIRHMFDSTETGLPDLKTALYNAILLKVGKHCKIEDFQLDLDTCCVYIRCKSVKDAGIIHNEINGWWFDNHLISIKFLHLNRYLARFPESAK